MVELQCCVSFRCTAKWISYTYTYIHSFLDSFPIYAITEYWVEFPVLYSRCLLVIYFIYSSGYISIPNSQFIPPQFIFINMNLYLIYTYKLHWRPSVISSQLTLLALSPYTSIQYKINQILLYTQCFSSYIFCIFWVPIF